MEAPGEITAQNMMWMWCKKKKKKIGLPCTLNQKFLQHTNTTLWIHIVLISCAPCQRKSSLAGVFCTHNSMYITGCKWRMHQTEVKDSKFHFSFQFGFVSNALLLFCFFFSTKQHMNKWWTSYLFWNVLFFLLMDLSQPLYFTCITCFWCCWCGKKGAYSTAMFTVQ